jgi:murein endopeptidase
MITTLEDAGDYLMDRLQTGAGELGLATVAFADKLVGDYPAVVITPGGRSKDFHATHKFNIVMEMFLAVYHAKLTVSHSKRTKDDLVLVTSIEKYLEQDMRWRDTNNLEQVTIAWIRDQVPGYVPRPKGEAVVGTRMIMEIRSQEMFA